MTSTLRFLWEFLRPRQTAILQEATRYRRGEQTLPATLYRPAAAPPGKPLPGWIVLHGLTRKGREHPSLQRFAGALAASGAVVFIPELPEWRELRIAPETTVATIKAAVLELDARPMTEAGRIGVVGFSFGATQSLIAATDPILEGHLAGVVAWGGYADIHRATRFAFLGVHELDGVVHELDPDPYGRWILTGNYLTLLPEHAGERAVSEALLSLAQELGRLGIMSWSPQSDRLKEAARAALSEEQRELFDLLAPPATSSYTDAERVRLEGLVRRMTERAVASEPLLEAGPYLPRVPVPIVLAHGRGDRLMPWTEMIRMRRAIPSDRLVHSTVTSLFSHSFGERRFPTPAVLLDVLRFVRLIRRMIRLI